MRRRLFAPETAGSRKRRRRRIRLASMTAWEPLEARQLLAIITVNSAEDVSTDPAIVTLRDAIELANSTPETDTIVFDIPGVGVHTIQPATPLPTITSPVFIDGESQGTSASPLIELDGSLITTVDTAGLVFGTTSGGSASASTLRGLTIHSFTGAGVAIEEAGSITIQGNFLGTDSTGTLARPNAVGISIHDSASNTIGGLTDNQGNLISGNTGDGIRITGGNSSENVIQGNRIGVDAPGSTALANGGAGVLLASDGTEDGGARKNTVGGPLASARNIISGNTGPGVLIQDASTTANIVQGNYLGLSLDGNSALPNLVGVEIRGGARDNTVGGFLIPDRNVISGNAEAGVRIVDASNNRIAANYIGTNADASAALSGSQQTTAGILIQGASSGNSIGGLVENSANVISGNSGAGVWIQGPGDATDAPKQNRVEGNFIGTNADGDAAIPNAGPGVVVSGGASNNTIGANSRSGRNIISGNASEGIVLSSFGTTGNQVIGNLIGLAEDGETDLGNQASGIRIDGASNSSIGGSEPGSGNSIAFNQGAGVLVSAGNNNAIQHNAIFSNTGLGIDLEPGANRDQQFPVLTKATAAGTASRVSGTLQSRPNETYTIEFYSNTENNRQGKTFVGSTNVTTGSSGNVTFSATTSLLTGGQYLTAIAIDSEGNTSEFSEPIEIFAPQSELSVSQSISTPTPAPANTAIAGGFLTYTILVTNHGPDPAESVTLVDDLPSGSIFVGAIASQGSIQVGSGTVTVSLGSLGNQETATITITVVAPKSVPGSGTISNTVTAKLPEGVPVTNPENSTSTLVSDIIAGIDLGLTLSTTPTPSLLGQNVSILLTITNNNEQPATGLTLVNTLPEDFELISVNATSPITTSQDGRTLTIQFLESLPTSTDAGAGASARVVIVGRPTATGSLTNSATVRADQGQTVAGHNSALTTILVVDALPPVSPATTIPNPTAAPQIRSVARLGRGPQATRLVLAFDQALEAASAENLANYRLEALGRAGRPGSRGTLPIRLRGAEYNAENATVTLTTARPLGPAQLARLTVNGTTIGALQGANGLILDGDGNSQPGGDFVSTVQNQGGPKTRPLDGRIPNGRPRPRGWRF